MTGAPPLLLYDGTCGFCSATVRLVLRHDRTGALRFASLQGPTGTAVRSRHPRLANVDSVVWVTAADGARAESVAVRSDAALHVAAYLGGRWRLALAARLLPRALRDRAYDWVARHRHRLAGTTDRCFVPPPDVRARFLD